MVGLKLLYGGDSSGSNQTVGISRVVTESVKLRLGFLNLAFRRGLDLLYGSWTCCMVWPCCRAGFWGLVWAVDWAVNLSGAAGHKTTHTISGSNLNMGASQRILANGSGSDRHSLHAEITCTLK